MKLALKLDYSKYLIFPAEQAGVIIPAFSTGQVATSIYKDGRNRYELKAPEAFEFQIVDDSQFADLPEPLAEVQKRAKEAEDRWYREYLEKKKLNDQVEELTKKLEAMKNTVSEI